jgi:hypothetical protein
MYGKNTDFLCWPIQWNIISVIEPQKAVSDCVDRYFEYHGYRKTAIFAYTSLPAEVAWKLG